MTIQACKFFMRGCCKRGDNCSYAHEITTTSTTAEPTRSPTAQSGKMRIPCRYHLLGSCKRGDRCWYDHSIDVGSQLETFPPTTATEPPNEYKGKDHASRKDSELQNLKGARVEFGPGAEVIGVELASDFSSVQITCLHPHSNATTIQRILRDLGASIPLSCIYKKSKPDTLPPVAVIKVKDPSFGHRVRAKFAEDLGEADMSGVDLIVLQESTQSESFGNHLQVNSVSVAWYKPSRFARLYCQQRWALSAIVAHFDKRDFKMDWRKIEASMDFLENDLGDPPVPYVLLPNLNVSTSKATIEQHLPSFLPRVNVILGEASYSSSTREISKTVRTLLESLGPLDTWQISDILSTTQVKVTARFRQPEDARKAVKELNKKSLPILGNSKIFVAPCISVKINILREIYAAISPDLEKFQRQTWNDGYTNIKVYPPTNPMQKCITVRIYGKDVEAVANAKSHFEHMLAGEVAVDGGSKIWDDYFSTAPGLIYLKELGSKNKGYICRDIRKRQLALFGTQASLLKMTQILHAKLDELKRDVHEIPLDDESYMRARRGAFQRIEKVLGKENTTLHFFSNSKYIRITGSSQDLKKAQRILAQEIPVTSALDDLKPDSTTPPDCTLCWSSAENPYRTPCGHHYCLNCFINQCTSTTAHDYPLRCHGYFSTCRKPFPLDELRDVLPAATYDHILSDSFATHIRTHPSEFSYCPTPDCDRIYRCSTTGAVWTCTKCLTATCTRCHVRSHDGVTCEQYQKVSTKCYEEFQQWKEEHDVKDCPGCKAAIEKTMGCEHVECVNCGKHICWKCLAVFEGSEEC
ncbi:hypothetical protein ACLMJK_002991 [Lecanora helva]